MLVGADGESKDKDAYVLAVKITPDELTGGGGRRGSAAGGYGPVVAWLKRFISRFKLYSTQILCTFQSFERLCLNTTIIRSTFSKPSEPYIMTPISPT